MHISNNNNNDNDNDTSARQRSALRYCARQRSKTQCLCVDIFSNFFLRIPLKRGGGGQSIFLYLFVHVGKKDGARGGALSVGRAFVVGGRVEGGRASVKAMETAGRIIDGVAACVEVSVKRDLQCKCQKRPTRVHTLRR